MGILIVSFFVLATCLTVFVIDNLTEFYNLSVPNYTRHREVIQTIAISLLAATLLVIASELWQLVRENKKYQYTLGDASVEFQRILYEKFKEWNLSNSEKSRLALD